METKERLRDTEKPFRCPFCKNKLYLYTSKQGDKANYSCGACRARWFIEMKSPEKEVKA